METPHEISRARVRRLLETEVEYAKALVAGEIGEHAMYCFLRHLPPSDADKDIGTPSILQSRYFVCRLLVPSDYTAVWEFACQTIQDDSHGQTARFEVARFFSAVLVHNELQHICKTPLSPEQVAAALTRNVPITRGLHEFHEACTFFRNHLILKLTVSI